jgi:hypothetical protein
MAPIELPCREEVQGCHKEAYPPSIPNRMEKNVHVIRDVPKNYFLNDLEEDRYTEATALRPYGFWTYDLRHLKADDNRRDGEK